MVVLSLAFVPTIFLIILLVYRRTQGVKFKLPPGPWPWPIVGNVYSIKPVHFKCFYEWAQFYGPIISVWFGSDLNIVVSSSELAKKVLKHHDQELADRYRNRSQANFTKDGIDLTWADYGPHFVKVRKICSRALFTNKMIEAQRPIREDEATFMIESIYKDCSNLRGGKFQVPQDEEQNWNNKGYKGKQMITLRKYLMEAALNHITRITFGKRFINLEGKLDEQGQKFMRIILGVRNIKRPPMVIEHVPWLRWMLRFYDSTLNKFSDRMEHFVREILEEGEKQNLVHALLSFKEDYGLNEETIVSLLWDMVMAGVDTIAITVEWAMAELLRHPRIIQKAKFEMDNIIGHERSIIEQDFENLPYLQAIVKEALRMHPPTPLMLPHKAKANLKIEGYEVPKGTTVNVNVWAIARDPDIWPNPHEFRPERFLEEDIDVMDQDLRFLPFGAGRRVCMGAQMSINLVTLMLGRLLHLFEWCPPSGAKPEEISMAEIPGVASYMATPLQIVPCPRLPTHLYVA